MNMKLISYAARIIRKISRRYRLIKCHYNAFIFGTELRIDKSNNIVVPLHISGKGTVNILCGNSFGFKEAPILGKGTNQIQARSPKANVIIGSKNHFSNNISIIANCSVHIGNSCQIGDMVAIFDSDFHEINPINRNRSSGKSAPVIIGNNVWIGSRSVVLKGVTIGDNSVIGAMSLVSKPIPANCIAVGNPAKVLRTIE